MLFNVQSSLSWEHFSCYVIPWTESEVSQVAMTLIFYKGKPKLSYKVSYNEVDLKKGWRVSQLPWLQPWNKLWKTSMRVIEIVFGIEMNRGRQVNSSGDKLCNLLQGRRGILYWTCNALAITWSKGYKWAMADVRTNASVKWNDSPLREQDALLGL